MLMREDVLRLQHIHGEWAQHHRLLGDSSTVDFGPLGLGGSEEVSDRKNRE